MKDLKRSDGGEGRGGFGVSMRSVLSTMDDGLVTWSLRLLGLRGKCLFPTLLVWLHSKS